MLTGDAAEALGMAYSAIPYFSGGAELPEVDTLDEMGTAYPARSGWC